MAGAEKHRNPDEDLPGDFEERRAEYYRELGRDTDARAFTTVLKSKLTDALTRLNRTIPVIEGAHPVARQEPDLDHAVRSAAASARGGGNPGGA